MNKIKIIQQLKAKFPGKKIITNREPNPTEIICEIDPQAGKALAVIDSSIPHYHHHTTEQYKIQKGRLSVFVDGIKHQLEQNDAFVIKPGQKHYAIGRETWVEVISTPPWSPDDHII